LQSKYIHIHEQAASSSADGCSDIHLLCWSIGEVRKEKKNTSCLHILRKKKNIAERERNVVCRRRNCAQRIGKKKNKAHAELKGEREEKNGFLRYIFII